MWPSVFIDGIANYLFCRFMYFEKSIGVTKNTDGLNKLNRACFKCCISEQAF